MNTNPTNPSSHTRHPEGSTKPPIDLEREFSGSILIMIAGNCDRWWPGADMERTQANVDAAAPVAEGIASKLVEAMNQASSELDEQRWHQLVNEAARNAFIEQPGGPLVKLGKNPSFIGAVADCTASAVAPAGSDWAKNVTAREECRHRSQLQALGLPQREVEKLMNEWRTLHRTR